MRNREGKRAKSGGRRRNFYFTLLSLPFALISHGALSVPAVVFLLSAGGAGAELVPGHAPIRPAPGVRAPIFTRRDFLRLTFDPPPATVRMGEPYVIDLRLVNHTEFTISAATNFHPRGNLKVFIRPYGERERQVYGPYQFLGRPPDKDYVLYPLEEYPAKLILWSDLDTPNGLAFPKPGRYFIRFELTAGARFTEVRGKIPLVSAYMETAPPFEVNVLPPAKEYASLIDLLIEHRAFASLQLLRMPEGLEDRIAALIEEYPATPITSFLDYSLARRMRIEAGPGLENEEAFNLAVHHLRRAALAASPYQVDAYQDLVELYDGKGMGDLARDAAIDLIKTASPLLAPRYGSLPVVKKYIIDSGEISPKRYWQLLE